MNTLPLATALMGTKIKTPKNEEIGVVQNIMIDPQNGTIVYVVLCYADFLGRTHRHFAIPREVLKVKHGPNTSIYLEVDKKKLIDAQLIVPDQTTIKHIGNNKLRIYELMAEKPRFAKSYA